MEIAKIQESLALDTQNESKRASGLFRLVSHEKWLATAAYSVLKNSGSNTPGPDGVTKANFGEVEDVAKELSKELKEGVYTPGPVRRVEIPKANGKTRPLGIPNLRDRVVQEAARMALEPVLEGRFLNCSTGFRPRRRTMDAVHLITGAATNSAKMYWVVEGDIKGCFDNIPHRKLLGVLRQHVKDKRFLSLIGAFLNAGILINGKVSRPNAGVPQGGVISPLLANMYLHEMDKYWWEKYGKLTQAQKATRRRNRLGNVRLVRYADDFVLMTNGTKENALKLQEEFRQVLLDLGLELSEEKTLVTHVNDGFDFLGFHIKRTYSEDSAKYIMLVHPSQSSIDKVRSSIREITGRETVNDDAYNKMRALNAVLRGWTGYYQYVNSSAVFSDIETLAHSRMYRWFKAKHSSVRNKSVGKYVVRTYLRRRNGRLVWTVSNYTMFLPSQVKIRKYYINTWPKSGNVYLEAKDIKLWVEKQNPVLDNVWRGHTEQNAYALARLAKLRIAGYKCEKCSSTKGYLHADHVIPKSLGGSNSVANLQILCESCHIKKTAKDRKKLQNRKVKPTLVSSD